MKLNNEVWKPIPSYEGYYEASNTGRIRSLDRVVNVEETEQHCEYEYSQKGKILIPILNNAGYYRVSLVKERSKKIHSIHRLVAKTFIDNPNNYQCVNHIDENKLNNNVYNLEWCTHRYNTNHGNSLFIRSQKQRFTNKNMKPVIAMHNCTQIEFDSIRSAARFLNLKQSNIQKALKTGNKCGKYNWRIKE